MITRGVKTGAADVLIVGGGVAGLSVAALLARHVSVVLLEREPLLASQASGNNAAIFRPLEHDALSAQLAARSRELLYEWATESVLSRKGLVLVSEDAQSIADLARVASDQSVAHEVLDRGPLWQRVPWLAHGQTEHGLWLTDGGVLDLHLLTSSLARAARDNGAQLRTSAGVAALERDSRTGNIHGVRLSTGETLYASCVVLAAGAWSVSLAAAIGLGLPLKPLLRHLVQLRAASGVATAGVAPASELPVVWRLEDEVYFRSESGGILASPCDESGWAAEEPPRTDPAALQRLAQKLERTAPVLAHAEVRRSWACLRTFAPDRELVVGADPRAGGLYWLAGLGGRGMSVALAGAEILTRAILTPLSAARYDALTIARLL